MKRMQERFENDNHGKLTISCGTTTSMQIEQSDKQSPALKGSKSERENQSTNETVLTSKSQEKQPHNRGDEPQRLVSSKENTHDVLIG